MAGAPAAGNAAPGRQTSRAVEITFSDRRYLDLLPWHDLRVARVGEDGSVIARTEYYGGMWLPRMIAACGGAARTTDAEVTRLAADYARALLSAGRSADA